MPCIQISVIKTDIQLKKLLYKAVLASMAKVNYIYVYVLSPFSIFKPSKQLLLCLLCFNLDFENVIMMSQWNA